MTDFELVPRDPERRINGDISFPYNFLLKDIVEPYVQTKESEDD